MTLDLFAGACSWLGICVALPFLVSLWGRSMALKGTERWHRFNAVVVTLRPLVKPTSVLYIATDIVQITVLNDWRWYTLLLVGWDLLVVRWYWSAAEHGKDDDEGGPWSKIRDAIKRLAPGSLTPATSGA